MNQPAAEITHNQAAISATTNAGTTMTSIAVVAQELVNGQQDVVVVPSSAANIQQQQMVTIPLISGIAEELRELIDEMRLRDYDSIRFATYRAASKLRFIQTKTNVHQIDIWNMVESFLLKILFPIESFRENGLNAMTSHGLLKVSRLELLLTSVYHNLNKRLPANQQVDTDKNIATLLHFLLSAYDRQRRLTVFAIKVGLATLCSGKLVDKLRYIFSQISEPSGALLDHEKFAEYLQQVLALPTAVFEGPTFGYSQLALSQCFQRNSPEQVTLNRFLDTILGESCPPCLMWLPLLHRMAAVENVYHPVVCDSCQIRSFTGFRYKCQRCTNYQLCQSCFFRGRVSQTHTNEHEMKEYNSYKSPTKQLAHTIQKSLQCVPTTHQRVHKDFPSRPQRALDLNYVVPSTQIVPFRRQLQEQAAIGGVEWTAQLLPGQFGNPGAMDDEHKLIARYAAKLAGRTVYASSNRKLPFTLPVVTSIGEQQMLGERVLIARLEEENQEILREMQSLEEQQAICDNTGQLNTLRERTMELEVRMREKQLRRRELMEQLEHLMAQLNSSPMPTIYSSVGPGGSVQRGRSTTSGGIPLGQLSLASFGTQPSRTAAVSQLQGDLLQAADAITMNMSELVRELGKKDGGYSIDEAEIPANLEQRRKEPNAKTRSNSANEALARS